MLKRVCLDMEIEIMLLPDGEVYLAKCMFYLAKIMSQQTINETESQVINVQYNVSSSNGRPFEPCTLKVISMDTLLNSFTLSQQV